jgi:hypothetical protein
MLLNEYELEFMYAQNALDFHFKPEGGGFEQLCFPDGTEYYTEVHLHCFV